MNISSAIEKVSVQKTIRNSELGRSSGQVETSNALEAATEATAVPQGTPSRIQRSNRAEQPNKFTQSLDRRLKFYVHKETQRVAVKVLHDNTDEVIKEIPPEEYLDLIAKIDQGIGALLDMEA